MKTIYRYRKERHYGKPPEAIWPFVADTARINELTGSPPYRVEERADASGRIHRFASVGLGPIRLRWEEGFGEWQENRRLMQVRHFINGPIRRFEAGAELFPEGAGSRMVYSAEIECVGILGLLANYAGQIEREGNRRLAVVERLISADQAADEIPGSSAQDVAKPAARRRLAALVADLARDPASHGLAEQLAAFLLHAPVVALRSVRPLSFARLWRAKPDDAVELFLAAQRRGILAMGWDLLCPRCRARSRTSNVSTNCRRRPTAHHAISTIGAISPATSN